MTQFDYSSLAATALSLIERFGQSGTVRVPGSTPGSTAWREENTDAANVSANIVLPSQSLRKGTGVGLRANEALVSVPSGGEDLEGANQLTVGGKDYGITAVRLVKPGDTLLLYKMELAT